MGPFGLFMVFLFGFVVQWWVDGGFPCPMLQVCARLMCTIFVGWVLNPEWLLNNGSIVVFKRLLTETFLSTMGHASRPIFHSGFVVLQAGPWAMMLTYQ